MGLFDGISNPWEPGGKNALSMPWAKPAMNYGWGHGNDFFHPKTKEQIHKEAMLQLAVLAAIVVAPMVLGAAGAAGAASAGAGAGAGAAGAGSAGAGAVATTAAVEALPIVATSTSVAATSTAGAAVAAGGAGISMGGAMALGGLGALQALQPFLQPNAMQVLHGAASQGEAPLNEALHRLSQESSNRVEYQREEPYRSPVSGMQPQVPSLSSGELPLHDSVPMLVGLAEEIWKDAGLQRELKSLTKEKRASQKLLKVLIDAFDRSMNHWEFSNSPLMLKKMHQQGDPLRDIIEKALESTRFKSLWDENEFDLDHIEEKIKQGSETRYWYNKAKNIDYLEINIRENNYDILAITHELTNRKYRIVLEALDDEVAKGEISTSDYAEGIIGIEINGITNKIIVAAELEIPYEAVQSLVDYYRHGNISEEDVQSYIRDSQTKAIIKDTGLPALEHYRLMGQIKRQKHVEKFGY